MNISKERFNISRKSLLIGFWVIISALLLLLDFKYFVSFNSVDERLFLTISQSDTSVHFLRYVVWGSYISFLYDISPYAPPLVHLFLFFISLSFFIRKFNVGQLPLLLLLSLPSLLLFSQTYLRDFFLLILNLFLFLNLRSRSFRAVFIVRLFLLGAIFVLRPIFGVLICTALIFSFSITRLRHPFVYLLLGQTIILIVLLNFPGLKADFLTGYKGISSENYFSLFHFGLGSLNEQQILIGIFLNWLLFYCGINVGMNNVIFLLPFVLESLIYLFFMMRCLLQINTRYIEDRLYRFAVLCIIFSMLIAVLESDWASVYRHKLFFLAPLLYISSSKGRTHDFS